MCNLNSLIDIRNNRKDKLENLSPISNIFNHPIKFANICSENYRECKEFQTCNKTGKLSEDYANKILINAIIMKI